MYFYVSNQRSDEDRVGLPVFTFAPSPKTNWDGRGRPGDKDVDMMVQCIEALMKEGLQPEDLKLTWLSRRVRPLQNQAHKMCFMSGRLDPTRLSMKNYSTSALDSWMLMITRGHVGED